MHASFLFIALGTVSVAEPIIENTNTPNIQVEQIVQAPVQDPVQNTPVVAKEFSAFTGKILKNKVRMRLQPNLDGAIFRELKANDLIVVLGESDAFYAVEPPANVKAYIYRTFVLDGVVEGSHVNVRLEPDLNSPVIAQLNSGDTVQGSVSSSDKKWIEILPPASTRFYVAKEYVKNIGSPSLMATLQQRREKINAILTNAAVESEFELNKPYAQINLEPIAQNLNTAIAEYSDFPEEVAKAKEQLTKNQTAYSNKKQEPAVQVTASSQNAPAQNVTIQSENDNNIQTVYSSETASADVKVNTPTAAPTQMSAWIPVEHALYGKWAAQSASVSPSMESFYEEQQQQSESLKGIVEPYTRLVRNKPGDYLLLDPKTRQPIAYLYSTKADLQDKIGQEVVVQVAQRDNNNFAFPAYFVLSLN